MAHLHPVELVATDNMLRQVAELKDLADSDDMAPTLEWILQRAMERGLTDQLIDVKQRVGILPVRGRAPDDDT